MTTDFEPIPAEIDAMWLTAVYHRADRHVDHRIVDVEGSAIGTGQVGDNVRYRLTWDDRDAELPATLVAKLPSASEISRATAVNLGTYAREIGFYRDLQHAVTIRTPAVLHVGWDPATHDFVVLMEDIDPAEAGDQLAGCTLARAESVIDQVVGLHAPTWGRTDELRRFDWLGFPDADRTELLSGAFHATFPGFAERYATRLDEDDLRLGAAIVDHYVRLQELSAEWAAANDGWCVVHGDYRLDNILFGAGDPAPPVTVVDWQTVSVGTGPADVAYFCGAGLLPPEREEAERHLVDRYAAALAAHGIDLDADAAWDGYVLGSASGYLMAVIASQIVERTERGDEMFAVMAERHAAQIRHVGLLERL